MVTRPITKRANGFQEPELHPFVARTSKFEPILTHGQKLTPSQKKHLSEISGQSNEDIERHLQSFHGRIAGSTQPSATARFLDVQGKKFGGLTQGNVQRELASQRQSLQTEHRNIHLADIEERVRTAPKRKPLTAKEYKEAGVDVAPGFED